MSDRSEKRAEPGHRRQGHPKAGHRMQGLEMAPEEMRRLGYGVVDRIVERWAGLREGSAWEGGTRRELEPLMAENPPEEGVDPDVVLDRATRDILPRAGRIDHPRFFAFIPSSPT